MIPTVDANGPDITLSWPYALHLYDTTTLPFLSNICLIFKNASLSSYEYSISLSGSPWPINRCHYQSEIKKVDVFIHLPY